MADYVFVEGHKYDKMLLDMANKFMDDDQISFAEALQLWDAAVDGPGITECEKDTLQHILEKMKCTEKASHFLQRKLKNVKRGVAYYTYIDGEKYNKLLLEMAQAYGQNSPMDRSGAAALAESAKDGPEFTQCEQKTLEYILNTCNLNEDARSLLRNAVAPKTRVPSFYVEINNVKYDRFLLNLSDKLSYHGEISLTDAKGLWDKVWNGRGITECEKRTIEYILRVHSCTPRARNFLHRMLLKADVLADEETPPPVSADPAQSLEAQDAAQDSAQDAAQDPAQDAPYEPREDVPGNGNEEAIEVAKQEVKDEAARLRRRRLEKEEQHLRECEEKYGKIFDEIDVDKDGTMTKEELERYVKTQDEYALVDLGIGRWEDFLKEIDIDQNGQIQRDEFIVFFSVGDAKLDADRMFSALFDAIDTSQDGKLQKHEILEYQWYRNPCVMHLLGVGNFSELVSAMDANGDGDVTKDEFVSYLKGAVGHGKEDVAAWKTMLQAGRTATQDFGSGFGATKPGFNSCWDFARGYCGRGEHCRWQHDAQLDQAKLEGRRKASAQQALEKGVNLTQKAHSHLQSLDEKEAEELLASLAPGGDNAAVHAKSEFICWEVRRRAARAAGKSWGSPAKRQRRA